MARRRRDSKNLDNWWWACCIELAPFGQLSSWDSGNVAGRCKELNMKCNTLKNCIATLERVRDVYSSRLDTGVLAELDDVITQLKRLSASKRNEVKLGTLSHRTLQIISQVISVVNNLTDLMK
jgi:hypothetical protein